MNDLISSVRLYLYEKLSSPFFGAFLASWIIWNHEYLFIIFSDTLPVEQRFNLAHDLLYPTWQLGIGRALVAPVVTSVLFILLYPIPELWLFSYWHWRQTKLRDKRNALDQAQMLSVEDSRKLTVAMLEIEEKYQDKITLQAKQIETLQAALNTPAREDGLTAEETRLRMEALMHDQAKEIEGKESEIAKLRAILDGAADTQLKTKNVSVDPEGKAVLKEIAVRGGTSYPQDMAQKLSWPLVRVNHLIDQLENAGLVKTGKTPRGDDTVELTKNGRSIAVHQGLV